MLTRGKTTIFSLHSDSFDITLTLPKIKGFPKTWELIVEFVIFISKTIVIYCPYVCQEESDLMKRSNEVVGLHRGKAEEKWFNLVHVVLLVLAIKSGSSTEQLQSL